MLNAKINGQTIHYTDTGGDLPVLLFSHGLLMDKSMFDLQVAAFKNRYRCIAWDERGHGETGDATAPFSYYDSANDAVALLKHLGVDQAVFIGMSQGGFLSLRAALKHPHAVRAVILLGSQAGVEDPANVPTYTAMIESWASNGLSEEIAATLEHIIGGPSFAGAPWRAKWAKFSAANLHQIFATLVSRDNITDQLPKISKPTLVVHGDSDAAIPLSHAEEVARSVPNAKLAVIPGGGHAANMTHADAVNRAIDIFLATLA